MSEVVVDPFRMTCPRCGHMDRVPDDPADSIYTCSECGCRASFGVEMPRIVNDAHPSDARVVLVKVSQGTGDKRVDVQLAVDRQYGAAWAMDMLSVCDPERFKSISDVMRKLSSSRDSIVPTDTIPAPAPGPEEPNPLVPGTCACGKPSVLANGACADCTTKMLEFGS
jgi:hypothetical protein